MLRLRLRLRLTECECQRDSHYGLKNLFYECRIQLNRIVLLLCITNVSMGMHFAISGSVSPRLIHSFIHSQHVGLAWIRLVWHGQQTEPLKARMGLNNSTAELDGR